MKGSGNAALRRGVLGSDLYIDYHDREWGVPVHDDRVHFEFLVLEGAQAALSWSTILTSATPIARSSRASTRRRSRASARHASMTLLSDPGIVRNRLKVESAVNNARRFLAVQEEFSGFDAYIWRFVDGEPIHNRRRSMERVPASTKESDALSQRSETSAASRFVGSTIVYAHMQATGDGERPSRDLFPPRRSARA
jgi:DNA-3-methyladenine glycosylase I